MKPFCIALLSMISLTAEPRGSVHDAWSDWILDNQVEVEGEELSENEQELDQENFLDYDYND